MNSLSSLPPLHTTRLLVQAWPWLWVCSDLSISPSKCHQKLNLVLGISFEKCRGLLGFGGNDYLHPCPSPLSPEQIEDIKTRLMEISIVYLSLRRLAGDKDCSRALQIPCWHTMVSSSSLVVVAALVCWCGDELMIKMFWTSALQFTQL